MTVQGGARRVGGVEGGAVAASARGGFAARAVLYTIIGVLAARLAVGDVGEDASQEGAMQALASQPFGSVLLGALAVGLAGYAAFRTVQAVRGRGAGGVVRRRVVPAARAVVNGGLSFLAVQVLLRAEGPASESSVTAAVLRTPGGTWLVAALGLVVVAAGVKQLVSAWTGDVRELSGELDLPPRTRRLAATVGRLGHLGRGVVFLVTGGFLARAALTHDSESGVGLDAALGEVVAAPFGTPLLLAVAVCLVLFGVHCAVEAWYGHTPRGT